MPRKGKQPKGHRPQGFVREKAVIETFRAMVANFEARCERPEGDECWPWTGAFSYVGAPIMGTRVADIETGVEFPRRRQTTAIRIAWRIYRGEWPSRVLKHSCDSTDCVNPWHLIKTGKRFKVSAKPGSRALSDSQAERVVALWKLHLEHKQTYQSLADRFGVAPLTIRHILDGYAERKKLPENPETEREGYEELEGK